MESKKPEIFKPYIVSDGVQLKVYVYDISESKYSLPELVRSAWERLSVDGTVFEPVSDYFIQTRNLDDNTKTRFFARGIRGDWLDIMNPTACLFTSETIPDINIVPEDLRCRVCYYTRGSHQCTACWSKREDNFKPCAAFTEYINNLH